MNTHGSQVHDTWITGRGAGTTAVAVKVDLKLMIYRPEEACDAQLRDLQHN
jgi:hypothetical protein